MSTESSAVATEKDPVCGMSVNPASAKHWHAHSGQTYYFCCGGCRDKFQADLGKYFSGAAAAEPSGVVVLNMPTVAASSAHSHSGPTLQVSTDAAIAPAYV